jgi:hypothetical protein
MQGEIISINANEHGEEKELLADFKKRLVEDENPITGAELDEYVRIIVDKLKKIKKEERGDLVTRFINLFSKAKPAENKNFYLVDELDENELAYAAQDISLPEIALATAGRSATKLKKEKKFDEELFREHAAAVARIKDAFVEKLKAGITKEKSLKDLNYSKLLFTESSTQSTGRMLNDDVKLQKDLNERESVMRNVSRGEVIENLNAADKHFYELGHKKLLEVPPNSYLVRVEATSKKKEMVERLHLTDLAKESLKKGANPIKLLKDFRDNVLGGIILENNGLVLLDISLDNLGVTDVGTEEEQGKLFDLDYIVEEGVPITKRVGKMEYVPTSDFIEGNVASAREMVFQFGRSLSALRRNLKKSNQDISSDFEWGMRDLSEYSTETSKVVSKIDGKIQVVYPELKKLEEKLSAFIAQLESGEVPLVDQEIEFRAAA